MRRTGLGVCLGFVLAVVAIGAWSGARVVAETGGRQRYEVRFPMNRLVHSDLLARQIEEATGLNLYAEQAGEETDGGFMMAGPDQPGGLPFPLISEMTVQAYRRPLTTDEQAVIREVIEHHHPVMVHAVPPDYAKMVQAKLEAKGIEAIVDGNPHSGFLFILQGTVTDKVRAALAESIEGWNLRLQE